MTDPLLEELLLRPIGTTAAQRGPEIDDFTSSLSITGNTATAELRGPAGTVNQGRALKYIQDEGQEDAEWEVSSWYKVEYGPLDPVFDAEGEPVLDEAGEVVTRPRMESVKFTFKRRLAVATDTISEEVVETWRQELRGCDLPASQVIDGGTYVILIADPQFGKKGTAEAVENYKRGVLGHVAQAFAIADRIGRVHVAWMGDETENVVNSYGNQPHTVELNRSAQLELDYDMRVWALKQVLTLGKPTSASSVISNHGEWTRNGGKEPVTTQGDNASTYVARQVKALFDELEEHTGIHVEWFIGGGDPGVTVELSGVECYFSHGYIEKGKGASTEIRTKSAIERQILGQTEAFGGIKIWFMAHYHHFYSNEFEGRSLFGCPALEAEKSSEYMLNQFGVWSPPGLLGMVITDQLTRGWSDINVY